MNEYKMFAGVYDKLIDVNYNEYADFIEQIFKRHGKNPELVLDLACGSGKLTTIMAKRGYDMIGIDYSVTMLNLAREKAEKCGLNILYLNQDMCDFELYGTVDAILCTLDSVNHITDKRDVSRMFSLSENYLNYGGLFIFDVNSAYKISEILNNNTFVYDDGSVFCVWENRFNKKTGICDFYLNCFEKNGSLYNRFEEQLSERAYETLWIIGSLKRAGFKNIEIYGDIDFNKPNPKSERLFFVCEREKKF